MGRMNEIKARWDHIMPEDFVNYPYMAAEQSFDDMMYVISRVMGLEAERDVLWAAARLVLDRCTGQDFDRAAIAEALNVLAACLPDDVLLGPPPAIGFTAEAE